MDLDLIATLSPAGQRESRKTAERTFALNQGRLLALPSESCSPVAYAGAAAYDNAYAYAGYGDTYGSYAYYETPAHPKPLRSSRLQLRFDCARRNQIGFVFGTCDDCDVILPERDGFGRLLAPFQCVLAFDHQRRLILRDLHNAGAAVWYGGKGSQGIQGSQMHRGGTWILGGHRFTERNTPVVIRLSEGLLFRINVVRRDPEDPLYQTQVDHFPLRFVAGWNRVCDDLFACEDVASGAPDSAVPALSARSVLIDDRPLGEGGQAKVMRVWDAATGMWYAAKEPRRERYWKRLKREADLLERIDHENVIKLVCLSLPSRRLILEYAAWGTVARLAVDKSLSRQESLTIVSQCLSALAHLHAIDIVHRDVKPANILVSSRHPLCVKLSDFGYSRDVDEYLDSRVGTATYMAPEVHDGSCYTTAVDIWSLGVVAFELTHRRLPPYSSRYARKVVRELERELVRCHCPLLRFLSTSMITIDPARRYAAADCYNLFLQGPLRCCPPPPRPQYVAPCPWLSNNGATTTTTTTTIPEKDACVDACAESGSTVAQLPASIWLRDRIQGYEPWSYSVTSESYTR